VLLNARFRDVALMEYFFSRGWCSWALENCYGLGSSGVHVNDVLISDDFIWVFMIKFPYTRSPPHPPINPRLPVTTNFCGKYFYGGGSSHKKIYENPILG